MGTQSERKPNLRCFHCPGTEMVFKRVTTTAEVRGETVEITIPAFTCDRCGDIVLTSGLMSDRWTIASGNAYRRKHGLLTSGEIGRLRRQAGGTGALAAFLGVDNDRIDGWRMGDIQSREMDICMRKLIDIIRHRQIPSAAELLRSVFGDFCPGVIIEEDEFGFLTLKRPT